MIYNNKFKIDDILLLKLDINYHNPDDRPRETDRTMITIVTDIYKPYSIEYLKLKIISSNCDFLRVGEHILATDDIASNSAYVPFKDITLLN